MPYFGRAVGRAKGIGKIVYWDQGGGPKKAGLGPQIDVTTWGRRVIARRTNNCCCDPIELTSIRVSIPWGWKFDNLPWNTLQAPTDDNTSSGIVGPPRNDVVDGVIQTQRQIYSIVTFNKPISGNLSSSLTSTTFTPSVPSGTQICVCGLEQVTTPNAQNTTVCVQDPDIFVASIMKYYDLTERYTTVTQIPGGTSTPTTAATTAMTNVGGPGPTSFDAGYLTSGSRVLIEEAIPTAGLGSSLNTTLTNVNDPKGGVTVDMWSGQTTNNPNFSVPTTGAQAYNGSAPSQIGVGVDSQYYGGYNVPVMDVSNAGFAILSSSNKQNRYLGNGFGAFFANKRADQPLNVSGSPTTDPRRNIALVQGNYANNINEYYSADALYVSDGPVSWLDYDHALFINITSLMQVMLRNPTGQGASIPVTSLAPPQDGSPPTPSNVTSHHCDQVWNQNEMTVAPSTGAPASNAVPWQGWGMRQSVFPTTITVPAWADLLTSCYGDYLRQHITLDSQFDYGGGAQPGPNYARGLYNSAPNYNTGRIGATLGDVVEKLRQMTFNAFPSYTIQNVLRSKYDCGNDGFDGPVDDIRLSSGSAANKAISTATQSTGGLLTLLAFSLPAAAASAATPALPPTVGPSPPGGGGGTTPLPPGGGGGGTTPLPPGGGGGGGLLPPGGGTGGGTIGGGVIGGGGIGGL